MVSALVAASSAKPRRAIEEPKPGFRRKARAADEEPRPRSRRKARAADAEPVDPGGYPEPADPLGPDDQAGEEGSAPPPDPPSLGVKIFRLAREAVVILVIALIISTLIRTFGVEQFRVPTGSMEQTLYGEHDNGDGTRSSGDRIFVAKAGGYDRGDIVVFEDKQGWLSAAPAGVSTPWYKDALEFVGVLPDSSKRYLVKRLIGLPGDRVTCCDDQGLIEVNGTPLLEDYLYKNPDGSQVNPSDWEFDVTVPAGHVFVLGDHRNDSADSRYHLCSGTQQTPQAAFPAVEDIQGPVVGIAYPVSRWTRFHVPATFEGVPPPGYPPDEAQVAVYPMC